MAALVTLSCLPILVSQAVVYYKSVPNDKDTIMMYEDDVFMKRELVKHMPAGTDIRRAKHILEKNGFGCSILVNAKFDKNLTFTQLARTGKQAELSCVKYPPRNWRGFRTAWGVEISFRKNKITNADVSHSTSRWYNCCL